MKSWVGLGLGTSGVQALKNPKPFKGC